MKAILLAALMAVTAAAQPVPVIFDTDMGNDIDDALALAVLHALESRGEARLVAVTITKDNPWAAAYVDLVDTFYGRAHVPVGVVGTGKTPEDSPYIRVPAQEKLPDGTPMYPRRIQDGRDAPGAVALLRRVLQEQKDGSVVMIQVGFSTNLARLLDTDRDLIAKKVRLLSIMAGQFPSGPPEYNVKTDLPAAKKLFAQWPTPIVASGFEIGNAIRYPARSIENDFRYAPHHPVAEAYRLYQKMPYDRPAWDPTAALYGVRPGNGYFSLSSEGTITVDDAGRTHFEAGAGGKHRYLIVNDLEKAKTLEALVELASQPPGR